MANSDWLMAFLVSWRQCWTANLGQKTLKNQSLFSTPLCVNKSNVLCVCENLPLKWSGRFIASGTIKRPVLAINPSILLVSTPHPFPLLSLIHPVIGGWIIDSFFFFGIPKFLHSPVNPQKMEVIWFSYLVICNNKSLQSPFFFKHTVAVNLCAGLATPSKLSLSFSKS